MSVQDAPTTTDEPVSTDAPVDTSTNDTAPETDVEASLEEVEVSPEDLSDDDNNEPGKDEETEPEKEPPAKDKDTEPAKSKEDDEESDKPEPSDDESEEEVTPSEEPKSKEEQKRLNDEMAKRRIAERDLKKEQQARQEDRLQQYLDDAKGDEDEYKSRLIEVEAFNVQNERITNNEDKLAIGIDKAVANIDLFKNGTPEVQEALARSLDKFEQAHVQYNEAGRPVRVTGDVYQYLQTEADSIRQLLQQGARSEGKAKNKAKARTDTLPTRAPKEAKVDDDMAAFEEEAKRY